MGNWKLEVGKMVLYMAFPVSMFHYFNQVNLFEDMVIKFKQERYPADEIAKSEDLWRKYQKSYAEEELARLKGLDKSQ